MKKNLLIITLVVVALAIANVAYADAVNGKVVSVDAAAKTITINKVNAETGAEENAVISVNDTTTYAGVSALEGLVAGDEVTIEASQDATTQAWTAASVEKVVVEIAPVAEAVPATEAAPAAE